MKQNILVHLNEIGPTNKLAIVPESQACCEAHI